MSTEIKHAAEKVGQFFKSAFQDMADSARAQHEVDKANLNAVKAETKAQWEEAKLSPRQQAARIQSEREEQLLNAQRRIEEANARTEAAKSARK